MLSNWIDHPEDPRYRLQKPLPQRLENIFLDCRSQQMARLVVLVQRAISPRAPLVSMHAPLVGDA